MKCKTCGKTTQTIQAMLKHYRKDHPAKLKRKKETKKTTKKGSYCSKCGQSI